MQNDPTTSPSPSEGTSSELPSEAVVAVELCDPPADDPTIANRSEHARVVCGAPEGTNFSIVYVTPPETQSPSIRIGSAPDRDTAPWAQLTTRGLWQAGSYKGTEVSGDTATVRYTLMWSPNPKRGPTGESVRHSFTDEVTVGDTITHGPLSYTVLGITDTGEPTTSHVDLDVSFDPAVPLTEMR